jgi:Amt family ammonium transporter
VIGGNPGQLLVQLYSVAAVLAYSGAATFVILKALALVMPLRSAGRVEGIGLDVTEHGEEAYTAGDGAILVSPNDPEPGRRRIAVAAFQEGGR